MLLSRLMAASPLDQRYYTPSKYVVLDGMAAGAPATAYKSSTVWRAVNVLAAAVACMPIGMFRRLEEGGKERVLDDYRRMLVKIRPNAMQTSFRWRQHLMGRVVLDGNYYAHLLRAGDRIEQIRPLDGERMRIDEITPSGELVYIYTDLQGKPNPLQARDVFHARGLGSDPALGLSVFDMMRETLAQSLASNRHRTNFLRNEMRPSVVVTHPGTVGKAKDDLEKALNAAYGGPHRTGRVVVLDEGMKIEGFSVNSRDAQFIESEHFRVEEFLRWVGVPGVLVGHADKTATYASAEAFFSSFKNHNLHPWTRNIEEELTYALFGLQDELFIEFNLDAMMRPDSKARAEFYRVMVELGIYTRNEVRELENRNPLDGLDEPLTPMNMAKGNEGDESTDEPPAPPDDDGEDDDDAEDAEKAQLRGIAEEAAAALVRRELAAIAGSEQRKGLAERYAGDVQAFAGAVDRFYSGHAKVVAEKLCIPFSSAEAYCRSGRDEVLMSGIQACRTWDTERRDVLVRLIGRTS